MKRPSVVRQALIGLVKRGGSKLLQVAGFSGELIENVPVFQPQGFAAHIPAGSELILLPLGGASNRMIALLTKNTARELKEGEVLIFDGFGQEIHMTESGIKITGSVEIIDGGLKVAQSIKGQSVSDETGSMTEIRTVYNAHGGHSNGPASPQMI